MWDTTKSRDLRTYSESITVVVKFVDPRHRGYIGNQGTQMYGHSIHRETYCYGPESFKNKKTLSHAPNQIPSFISDFKPILNEYKNLMLDVSYKIIRIFEAIFSIKDEELSKCIQNEPTWSLLPLKYEYSR